MSNPDVLERFRKYSILATPQRVEVARVLLGKPQHLSAEQILERLRDSGSKVSKATVYNSLRLFSECGLVKEINVDPARKFYDSTNHAHHHFYNVDSGRLTDIAADQISIMNLPPLPEGTEQQGVEVLIRVRDKP